ncbi:MAG: hypothetical protein JO036_09310 [Candidatus Eremiobacteraeota bacterium]|nr:hypothetical protein [Candidatus Eremiobacteraeota bacterium]
MGFKKERLGPLLVDAARSGERYRDVHVFFGGTGGVGGTAVLELLSMYEEMLCVAPPADEDVPIIVATGASPKEIQVFTKRLFRYVQSRHPEMKPPTPMHHGYLTHSGVFIALERFEIDALPKLKPFAQLPERQRRERLPAVLEGLGGRIENSPERIGADLAKAVPTDPFSRWLTEYRGQWRGDRRVERFRSVTIGIPIPTLLSYHERNLDVVAELIDGFAPEVEKLKEHFVAILQDDLTHVRDDLTETLVIAHTTAVGGMYDEDHTGRISIRLGFAHSAHDEKLAEKQQYAAALTQRYVKAGINVLITAAAIGVDEVRIREHIPLHSGLRQRLDDMPEEMRPIREPPERSGRMRKEDPGERKPRFLRWFQPITVTLDATQRKAVKFDEGEEIVPSYALRSGENGFFSVANADALYRVMRVASTSELGLVLARMALLKDDNQSPWFPEHVCYYTESDNSRQVFDFLSQDRLRQAQLSGLDPMALQDLGSAKHQGELHTLALFILLHRLRTFDVNAIDPYVDLQRFDPEAFFIEHSDTLTLETVASWRVESLASDLRRLVSADSVQDLEPLLRPTGEELFPKRRDAKQRVLSRALHAVWAIPSLGSPIVFADEHGVNQLRTGYYIAPLELFFTHESRLSEELRTLHQRSRNRCSYQMYRDFNLATGGFIDVRPHAIVSSAGNDRDDLRDRVRTVRTEEDLRALIGEMEPYSFFSTCGLLAVLFRLRALHGMMQESMVEIGTLQSFRWQLPRDAAGRLILVPGILEGLRMVSEGLEKTTGTERLDGMWGYERREILDRRPMLVPVTLQRPLGLE